LNIEKDLKQLDNQSENLVKFAIKGLLSEDEFAKQLCKKKLEAFNSSNILFFLAFSESKLCFCLANSSSEIYINMRSLKKSVWQRKKNTKKR